MVWFDQKLQKIIVRLVYDGPARAGKTTNVSQLAAAFTTLRRGELLSHEDDGGRTLLFDWLHIDGGVIGGHALRCQLLTVPGQSLLARRRWRLIETADVLVFVCDSTPAGVREARRSFELLRARYCDTAQRHAIVIQANKQDAEGALPPAEVGAALDAGADVPVVAARAVAGVGVRETAVVAIRAAADIAQKLVLSRGIDALGAPDDGPEWLAETLKPLVRAPRRRPGARDWASAEIDEETKLPLPHAGIPTGYVWPADRGHAVLEALVAERAKFDVERRPPRAGEAVFQVGGWSFQSPARSFSSAEEARTALLAVAHEKVCLGTLCAERTTLAVVAGAGGRFWLWSIAPALRTFADAFEDEARREDLAESFGAALSALLHAAYARSISLTAEPSLLAKTEGGYAYLGGVDFTSTPLEATAESMLDSLARLDSSAAERASLARVFWRAASADGPFRDIVRRRFELIATGAVCERGLAARELLERAPWAIAHEGLGTNPQLADPLR